MRRRDWPRAAQALENPRTTGGNGLGRGGAMAAAQATNAHWEGGDATATGRPGAGAQGRGDQGRGWAGQIKRRGDGHATKEESTRGDSGLGREGEGDDEGMSGIMAGTQQMAGQGGDPRRPCGNRKEKVAIEGLSGEGEAIASNVS
eukprot:9495105-Pyramimonas_sp.AAC.2